jgi:zinc transport system substrate-binding protein
MDTIRFLPKELLYTGYSKPEIMNNIGLLLLAGIALISLGSCHSEEHPADRTTISVSILPQKYFIEKIAGEKVEVNVLIPPGASPATYEPSMAQLGRLDQSQLYMKIGYVGFELSWMDKIASVNPDMKIIDLSRGIDLIQDMGEEEEHHGHSHGGTDPHIWMSVINAKVIAANIYKELVLLFPADKEAMKQRFQTFNHELDSLHRSVSARLKEVENRNFLIYHPALSYFARDYNLHQYPIEIEGKIPSPAHLKKLTDLSKQKAIRSIFIQSQFDQRNAEILASEIDAEIIRFNPLDENWKRQMLYIADQFNASL